PAQYDDIHVHATRVDHDPQKWVPVLRKDHAQTKSDPAMNIVRVLSTLALGGAVRNLAARYEAQSGARIDADFAPTLALLDRLRGGEAADIAILTREGLDALANEGSVVGETCVDLARSFVGIAVKAGHEHPDIA